MQVAIPHDQFDSRVNANGDDSLMVKFDIRPVMDHEASEAEQRPVFRDTEYISIRAPGSPDEVVRPATPADKERFPRHYAAFKQRTTDEEYIEGTLLAEWPLVNRSQCEELQFFGIRTVEQLASVSDANIQALRGVNSLKQKARDWLQKANVAAEAKKLEEMLAARDEQIEKLMEQVEKLSARDSEVKKKAKE